MLDSSNTSAKLKVHPVPLPEDTYFEAKRFTEEVVRVQKAKDEGMASYVCSRLNFTTRYNYKNERNTESQHLIMTSKP